MNTLNQLFKEAVHLPEDQRLSLAHKLLVASEPESSENINNAWDKEIRCRIAQYDRGETHSLSANEVFEKIDLHLKV